MDKSEGGLGTFDLGVGGCNTNPASTFLKRTEDLIAAKNNNTKIGTERGEGRHGFR
jgi:hypothetical protein